MSAVVRCGWLLASGFACVIGLAGCYGDSYVRAGGRVCDSAGIPIAGATVTLAPAAGSGVTAPPDETTTDAAGEFSNLLMFRPVAKPRAFVLRAEKAGYRPSLQNIAADSFNMQITLLPAGDDLRLMSWGDGSGVPTSGRSLVIAGTDNNGRLHIRIFDATGNRVTDTDETQLPPTRAEAIRTLKQRLPSLLPPHALSDAERAQLIGETTSIVGQTLPAGGGATGTKPRGAVPLSNAPGEKPTP